MDAAAISQRVADFLKQHPPFHAVSDADLLALAAGGRVRFHEAGEFILWQGEPHKLLVFVIQQGTVTLWDETGGHAELRDVRGAGDLLGAERFHGARMCLHSARATSDVVLYGFPADQFEALVLAHGAARQYVSALGGVTTDLQRTDGRPEPHRLFLHDVAGPVQTCRPQDSLAEVARVMARTGRDAVAVVDTQLRPVGIVTSASLLAWIAEGGGTASQPVSLVQAGPPPVVGPDATMTEGVIAIGESETGVVAMTSDGTTDGHLLALVAPRDLTPAFGDQPANILRDIARAGHLDTLNALNARARACALQHLTGAASAEWIARFTDLVNVGILRRVLALTGQADTPGCWCVCGAAGRGESITRREPHVVLIHGDLSSAWDPLESYLRVSDGLAACDFLPGFETPFEPAFYVASVAEWGRRFDAWMRNPVLEQMSRSRPLFDLRPFHGPAALYEAVREGVAREVDRDILQVLAHDCLASLPPLTFFQDAVVEESGERTAVFRLGHNALAPLVDVGRVFGMAARRVMGTSTLDRFAIARTLLPASDSIFRDAAATLRIVLWQQGRIGISQGTDGTELPPSLLGRLDRHMLKSGFPAIHRLLEFTADSAWLESI